MLAWWMIAGCACRDDGPPDPTGTSPTGDTGTSGDTGETGDTGDTETTPAVPDGALHDGPACSAVWCWEAPLPAGGPGEAITAAGPADVWYSRGPLLLHWDGEAVRWALPPIDIAVSIVSLWHGADDAWVGTPWEVSRWVVDQWTAPGLEDGFVAMDGPPDDGWALGWWVWHQDGSGWTRGAEIPRTLQVVDIASAGAGEAVIAGTEYGATAMLRTDGATLTHLPVPDLGAPRMVVAAGPDDLWLSASDGVLAHYDGVAWTTMLADCDVRDGWAAGPEDVWFLDFDGGMLHWDGREIDRHPVPLAGSRLAAAAGDDQWLLRDDGTVYPFDGVAAGPPLQPVPSSFLTTGVAVLADGTGWAASGADLLVRAVDGTWSRGIPPGGSILTGVASAGAETFLFGNEGAYRFDGTAWVHTTGGDGLVDACATDDGTIWGVGDGVVRYDAGQGWVPAASGTGFDLAVCAGVEAWAVDSRTEEALHSDGVAWSAVSAGDLVPLAARVTDAGDTLAVDARLVVYRKNGAIWDRVDATSISYGRGAAISGSGEIWTLADGKLRRWFDGAWDATPDPVVGELLLVGVDEGRDGRIYAVGGGGWILVHP